MLEITDDALTVLRAIPRQPMLPSSAGLRIARTAHNGTALRVTAVAQPRRDDHVIDNDGARVFLGPVATRRLHGRTLDARRDPHGRIEFVVRPS